METSDQLVEHIVVLNTKEAVLRSERGEIPVDLYSMYVLGSSLLASLGDIHTSAMNRHVFSSETLFHNLFLLLGNGSSLLNLEGGRLDDKACVPQPTLSIDPLSDLYSRTRRERSSLNLCKRKNQAII